MRHYDHRDPEHYVKQIRAMEMHERVSFLEIYGIGKRTIRALYKINVTTASLFMERDTDELIAGLQPFGVLPLDKAKARMKIDDWKDEIQRLLNEREGKTLSPRGEWI